LSQRKKLITGGNQRAPADTVFEREQRREREKTLALKMEAERHAAVIKNMQRLKALRLAREAKINTNNQPTQ
jgi:hypothetical protein